MYWRKFRSALDARSSLIYRILLSTFSLKALGVAQTFILVIPRACELLAVGVATPPRLQHQARVNARFMVTLKL
jgi:hypothetical protein